MSLPTARQHDLCTGHGCYPPRPASEGSPNVFLNDRPVHRLGDSWFEHCCAKSCHDAVTIEGSETVFANDKPVSRIKDAVSCGSNILTGSKDCWTG